MGYVPGTETNNIPFGVPLALRKYTELSGVQKFGYNGSVPSTFETVWDGSSVYEFIESATTCAVASDSGTDAGMVITVQGLNSDYQEISEDIVTGSTGTLLFQRVNRAFVKTPATGQTANVGVVTMTVDTKSAAIIGAGIGQTLMAIYTIPAHCRGFLLAMNGGVSKNQEVEMRLLAKEIDDGAAQTKAYEAGIGNNFHRTFVINEMFQPKTDIYIEAKVNATAGVSAGFELLLEKIN